MLVFSFCSVELVEYKVCIDKKSRICWIVWRGDLGIANQTVSRGFVCDVFSERHVFSLGGEPQDLGRKECLSVESVKL